MLNWNSISTFQNAPLLEIQDSASVLLAGERGGGKQGDESLVMFNLTVLIHQFISPEFEPKGVFEQKFCK